MEDIVLRETTLNPEDPDVNKQVEYYLAEKVQKYIEQAGKDELGSLQLRKKVLYSLSGVSIRGEMIQRILWYNVIQSSRYISW